MRDNYLEEYYSFLRFPSVSTDDHYKEKLVECADWLVNKLNRIGLQTQLVPTKRHPIVWARNEHQSGRPTVMMFIMMCNRRIRWNFGIRRPLSLC
jgi:acetylornithine deacetylase/succinyl-diaminopimelate desuccinylase-like protein